jgi:FkbM family methyltransferase
MHGIKIYINRMVPLNSARSLFFLRAQKLIFCLVRPNTWAYAARGCFPSVEHAAIVNSAIFSDIDCFYDVGANIGQFSLLLFSAGIKSPVIAFEPIPSCFKQLDRLSSRMKNLVCRNIALGSSDTINTLLVASSPDSSSFLEPTLAQKTVYGVTSTNRSISVKQLSLVSILKSYPCSSGFLKIDVQGYELNVLTGCENLAQYFKYIYVELSFVELYKNQPLFSEVFNYLELKGYCLIDIKNLFHSVQGSLVQGDFLFKRI